MYTKLISSGSLAVLIPLVSAANPFCKGGIPAVAASILTDFAPAVTYCSSAFPLPKVTSTRTAPTTTVTKTIATQSPLTTVATVTNTITPTTETITVTSDTQTDSVTITADTLTVTASETATTTSTSTVTTISIIQKRNELVGRTNPQAASRWSSVQKQAKSFLASVCTCLETPATNYATTTPSTTVSVTATSPISVTATATATATATSTVSATATITTTISVTATTSTTTTTTTTVIATVTQTVSFRGPLCNQPDHSSGVGGCSSQCFCDPRVPDGLGYGVCDNGSGCDPRFPPSCASDADCPIGQACAILLPDCQPQCVGYTACSSSFVPTQARRGLEVSVKKMSPAIRRAERVRAEKSLVCRRKGVSPEQCEA